MSPSFRQRTAAHLLVAFLCSGVLSAAVRAEVITEGPKDMIGVGVDAKRGNQLPLDLEFRDQDDNTLKLSDLITGDRPVLLSLNYSDCPMLCQRQLSGLVTALKEMPWNVGEEFDVVSISINPLEEPKRAKLTHQRYTQEYGRPGTGDGWHFLVGGQDNITAIADAVGFRYNFVPETGEYAHTAVLMVITPDGVVSRYLYGVMFDPGTVRLSMVEAGDGKVGSAMDQIFLTCFIYDHEKGKYGPEANRILQIAAAATILTLGLGLAPYWLRRRRSSLPIATNSDASTETTTLATAERTMESPPPNE